MITNLAIEGGGVKGIAFVGALVALQEKGILPNIKNVAGTSAGALVATLFSLGYSIEDMQQLMRGLHFKKFAEGNNPFRLFTSYGLHSGDYILNFVHDVIATSGKGLSKNATFLDFKMANCLNLYVFATDVNRHLAVEFSAVTTPNVSVAEAVRASMSIPIYFKAWKFSKSIPDDHVYVDGGMLYNYPLTFFDNERFNSLENDVNYETIGLRFKAGAPVRCRKKLSFNTPFHYIRHLIDTLLQTQNIDYSYDSHQVKRSVIIDSLGISPTDFSLNTEDMNNLVASGKKCMEEFIKVNYENTVTKVQ